MSYPGSGSQSQQWAEVELHQRVARDMERRHRVYEPDVLDTALADPRLVAFWPDRSGADRREALRQSMGIVFVDHLVRAVITASAPSQDEADAIGGI
jgi:hypothetical protein